MVKLFVEGGGDGKALRTECRQGLAEFLKKAGLTGHLPRTIACGGRRQAYDDFCTAISNGEAAILLVDSEGPVPAEAQVDVDKPETWKPWLHLARSGDSWTKPKGAEDVHCHLMIECMENWFLADRVTLQRFFDNGFRPNALPPSTKAIESVSKADVYQALSNATKDCKTKATYGKGDHSFKLLGLIDPALVVAASPWATRFVDETKRQMGC